jgi:hypothetical protein
LHLKVPLRKVENAIRCWNVYNTKLYDKTSGNCLRRTQISGIYITKGKIRLENACAYGAGSLPRYSTTTFTAIGRKLKFKKKKMKHSKLTKQNNYI